MRWFRIARLWIQSNLDASIFRKYEGFFLIRRTNPVIEILPYSKKDKLTRLKIYKDALLQFAYFNLEFRFRLIKGQIVDGPSIPQITQWLVSFLRLLVPGLFHDGAFGIYGILEVKLDRKWVIVEYNRHDADQLMRFSGHVDFAGDKNILLSNWAVTIFGNKFFKENKKYKPTHRIEHLNHDVLKVVSLK